jgi:hypothetical protein
MKAKSGQQLAQSLRSEVKETRQQQFDSWADARRRIFSKGVIEQLRKAWDQEDRRSDLPGARPVR